MLLPLLAFAFSLAPAPSGLYGHWVTPNRSVIETFHCAGNQVCARVVKIGPKNEPQQDLNNPDKGKRSQAICGLTIAHGFKPDGTNHAKSGSIYDPESGKTYTAEMQVEGDTLKLRGYIGIPILGRTEVWHRTAQSSRSCKE